MASESSTVKPLRSTGLYERYNITRNYVDYYTSVAGTATYSVPPRLFEQDEKGEKSFESIVLTALVKTVERHAPLGVGIKGEETSTPEYVRLGSNKVRVSWREVVKFLDIDGEGDQWVEDEHQLPFTRVGELPLWRVQVTRRTPEQEDSRIRFKVGFFFHHAIGDGISGGAFHVAFRDALNALLARTIEVRRITVEDEIPFSPTLELLPNIERVHSLPVSFFFILKLLIRTFVYRKDDPTHWKGAAMIPNILTTPPLTRVKSFSLDKDTTARLVQHCREEKSTVTSLVCFLIARKLATIHPDYDHFSGLVPFSFRRFTNTPDDEMTLQVTTYPYIFTKNPTDPKRFLYTNTTSSRSIDWEVIRALKQRINDNIKPNDSLVGMLRWAGDIAKYFRGKQGTKRDASFELSNIGVIDGGNGKGEVFFERFMFSACIPSIAAPYSFTLAAAKGGEMTMVLQWEEGVSPREEAEELVGSLEKELRDVGKEEGGVEVDGGATELVAARRDENL